MEEPISPKKDPIGQESEYYLYKGDKIEVFESFLYEVSIHKYWKSGYCLLGSKLFKSDKLLNVKVPHKYKYFKDYIIMKEISLVAAPYKFIRDMKLPIYKEPVINKLNKRKKK